MKKFVYILSFIVLLVGCKDDFTPNDDGVKISVDGYIETGQFAKIVLTFPVNISDEITVENYSRYLNTDAKVSINNGTETEILTLKEEVHQFPCISYTTSLMKGEAGKTYALEIEYNSQIITAETTIPQDSVVIDSLWCEDIEHDSLNKAVWMCLDNTNPNIAYCRIFSKDNHQHNFYPIQSATYESTYSTEKMLARLQPGEESMLDTAHAEEYRIGDTVQFKFATMGKQEGAFWKYYEKYLEFNNPFQHCSILPSNIRGGLGIWCGYNCTYRTIVIR